MWRVGERPHFHAAKICGQKSYARKQVVYFDDTLLQVPVLMLLPALIQLILYKRSLEQNHEFCNLRRCF